LGGQVNTLVRAPHRQEFGNATSWLERQVRQLGVEIRLGTELTAAALPPGTEALIVATGSAPRALAVPGITDAGAPPTASVYDVLEGRVGVARGQRVVLLDYEDNYRAASAGEFLADRGAQVHHVTGAATPGKALHLVIQTPLLLRLRQKGVQFWLEREVERIHGSSVALRQLNGDDGGVIEGVALIVLACPHRPLDELYRTIRASGAVAEVLAIGDCVAPRTCLEAIREGYAVARAL
jgi:thioredoxin reductase